MRSTAGIWQNWWMQLVAGLLIVAFAVLPWLWIGYEDQAILPYTSNDALGLLLVFSMATLLSAFFARRVGRGGTKFAVVTDVGVVLGFIALAFQATYVLEPGLFDGYISADSVRHLYFLGTLFVVFQILYFLIVKLQLIAATPLVALIAVGISYWLQVVASLVSGAQSYTQYFWYAGPAVLGLVLGVLGFLKAANLLIWILSLVIQWITPALFESAAALGQGEERGIGNIFSTLVSGTSKAVAKLEWQGPVLVSLATAMLTSVILLIVHKARGSRY